MAMVYKLTPQRIASLIGDGFTSGEILTTDTNGDLHRGWWRMFKE